MWKAYRAAPVGSGLGAPSSAPPAHSVFLVPGLHLLPGLLLDRCGLHSLHNAKNDAEIKRIVNKLAKTPFDFKGELERFKPFFNPHYALRQDKGQPGMGQKFTPAEDRLFATGLRRYGLDRFDAIRALMLPTKELSTLKKRYESASSRRADPNPIKRARYDNEPLKMNLAEMKLVEYGVSKYGEDWKAIRTHMLPLRTEREIEMAWRNKLAAAASASQGLPLPPVPPVYGALPPVFDPLTDQEALPPTAAAGQQWSAAYVEGQRQAASAL